MKNWGIAILICLPMSILGQDIPLNTWRSHFSYSEARIIEQAEQTIFCATTNALFLVDMNAGFVQKFNKEHGLGDVGISAMHYVDEQGIMVIGYKSGLIDLVKSDGAVITISTLKEAQIVGSKTIHSISSIDDQVYLATDFGVVLLDLASNSIKENYRNIGTSGAELSVNQVLVSNDSIYLLAEDGIRAGNLSDNLLDFNAWNYFPETSSGGFNHLVSSGLTLYVIKNQDELWYFNGSSWVDSSVSIPATVTSLHSNGELIALTATGIYTVLPNPVELISDPLLDSGNDLIQANDSYWVADGENGLLSLGTSTNQLLPNGPLKEIPTKIKWANGRTYAFYGPKPSTYDGTADGLGYSVFKNGEWTEKSIPAFYNLSDVAALGNNLYFTSMGFGLYDKQQGLILNETNSNLTTSSNFGNVQLSAVKPFNNSLWVLGYNSDNSIYEINDDGSMKSFTSQQLASNFPVDFDISAEGVIWAIRGTNEGGGVATFDPSTDLKRTIGTQDNLPSSTVTGISIDPDDEAWISTSNGIANFNSASFPFVDFDVSRPVFQNGILFEDEQINDVLTDGGGRIWVATESGIWVLARDLSSVVHRFSSENSPLASDRVLQLSYDENTGEVFVLTDKGVVSYRSASAAAEEVHDSRIGIFPNPVVPGFIGVVGFTGLVRNASIKITDVRGRLIQEIIANGGTASWNLRNFNNASVKSGVYLVFSSSEDGVETLVGKIAVVK